MKSVREDDIGVVFLFIRGGGRLKESRERTTGCGGEQREQVGVVVYIIIR